MENITIIVEWIAPEGLVKGKPTDDFLLPRGSTITDLVNHMVELHGEDARKRLLQNDGFTPYVSFIIGGKIVGFDYQLDKDMEVMILPPIDDG